MHSESREKNLDKPPFYADTIKIVHVIRGHAH